MEVKVEYSNAPPYNNNPYPRPVEVRRDGGCFERNRRNKPQSNSAGAAALVFISGGMNIAFGVGFTSKLLFEVTIHMQICWFIAAIIGAIVGAAVCNYIQKKPIYLVSALLIVLDGIIFVSLPRDPSAVIAAKYIDGFANGLVLAPTLVMVGEEAVKGMRGMLASTIETMCFSLGFYLQIIYVASWGDWNTSSFDLLELQGILSILWGIISFLIAFFLVVESPIYYLSRNQEEQAIDALRRLQRPFVVTTETYEQFEEHKRYMAVNKEMSFGQSALTGLPALLKLCFYRGMVAASFSLLLTYALALSSVVGFGTSANWPLIVYGTVRWLGVLISAFLMDTGGRKNPMLFGSLICGGMAIGIGVIFNDPYNILSNSSMATAVYLLFVFQLFAGFYISASSVYLCEAFPLAIKPFYICIAFCIEMLVHIIIISCGATISSIADYHFALGALMLIYFVFGILCFPETMHTTLREAQEKFRRFISPRN